MEIAERWTGLSATFLSCASAITASALMVHLKRTTGDLYTNGTLGIDATATNGPMNESFGKGVLATNILSIIFNGMAVAAALYLWFITKRIREKSMFQALFGVVMLSTMLAVATAGYNLYVEQNFGKLIDDGSFGTDCTAISSCPELLGTGGQTILGLNVATIAASGIMLLSYLGVQSVDLKWIHI